MAERTGKGPVMLVIMDGWGLREEKDFNAVKLARTPNYDRLTRRYPFTAISTSGTDVGLPRKTMGNSEVGHLNIGAGRVVWQELMRINNAIVDGSFFDNPALRGAIEHALEQGSRLHLFGLVSSAFVHSCEEHYFALIRMACRYGLSRDRVIFHVFTDGRDTPPRSGLAAVSDLERKLNLYQTGVVGTLIGRYYAMDRDKRWNRVELAYNAMVHGEAEFTAGSAGEAVAKAYGRADGHPKDAPYPAETDEFIRPTVIVDAANRPLGLIRDGDAVVSFNHRSDRPREIVRALIEEDFEERTRNDPIPGFERRRPPRVHLVTLTDYRAGFPSPVAFDARPLAGTLGEGISDAGGTQFHTAETEKYPHVTFFFNGGREAPFAGEERYMAASPQVATYDLQPSMSAPEVTRRALEAIRSGRFDFLVLNYANGDMVGHTGVLAAAIEAVEAVDEGLGALCQAVLAMKGEVLVTADHGNCEQMWDETSNGPHTAHTTNPVPCFLVSHRYQQARLREGGRLADLAPTLLQLLALSAPPGMEGQSLIQE
ncbi:MAG: 2,3-bisphosphoglycerate-independent phosphoglycerate mutase [Acidobacteriota bacterium]